MRALGFDTSNYTTSVAEFHGVGGENCSRLLDVKPGELGLRQSDALFAHVRRLPELVDALCGKLPADTVRAVGASTRPRAVEGSYMPCFLAGESQARNLARFLDVPFYPFSHQQGHIAAALWSAGRMELMRQPHLAWHLSGGTTELVTDDKMGQVLKMSRTSDGGETALIYDGLNITESDTRYVTVTAEIKLDKNGYAHQYSIPYIFNNSGAVAYSLFTNDSATKYQSHVNGKNTTDAGTLTTNTWQTVRMDIDMQSDTFSVSVDGVTTLRNVKARTATDNLQKIKFYADSWNRGTLYIKSVDVAASNESPIKVHEKAATYYVSNNGIDPTKIKNDLGWYPETPFEKGIVLTIDWYLNHQEWMDHVTSGDYQNYYQDMYKNK